MKTFAFTSILLSSLICFADLPTSLPPGNYNIEPETKKVFTALEKDRRADAWTRAQVMIPLSELPVPIPAADLRETIGDEPFKSNDEVVCKFYPTRTYGTGLTPKFYCILPAKEGEQYGRVIKVKYDNAEVYSEVVGTRLLRALGFGADTVYMPKAVRCFGCPPNPYKQQAVSYDKYWDPKIAIVEVKMPGKNMEAAEAQGWSFTELSKITNGATAAELDALRLLIAFLQHADTKAPNNRFICLPGGLSDDGRRCDKPFALMQDLGALFGGPSKLKFNVRAWSETKQVWADPDCTVFRPESYSAPTFPRSVRISEAGRKTLTERLNMLSDVQIADLFRGARINESEVPAWVAEFRSRVRYLNASNLECK